jgi:hypothetical protein
MSFLITILLLVNLGFVFFSVWAWFKKSDAISEIVAMTVCSGLVTLIAWGVTTDDKNTNPRFTKSKIVIKKLIFL